MTSIKRTVAIPLSFQEAYDKFVHEFNFWWPKAYTWSQDQLQSISIDARQNGLCTEIGPHGFRCDWGRVVSIKAAEKITFTWQISPRREPVPDPAQASIVEVQFQAKADRQTLMHLEHRDFEKHGEGAENYQQAMDSDSGWDYILDLYLNYCEKQS